MRLTRPGARTRIVGLEPNFFGGYRLKAGTGSITLGVYAGLNIFTATGVLISSENLLIPLGADVRYSSSRTNVISLMVRAAGGGALFMVNPNDSGFQRKFIPFASGGMGVNIGEKGAFVISIQANFTVYFEASLPIMGFSPSVNASLRL